MFIHFHEVTYCFARPKYLSAVRRGLREAERCDVREWVLIGVPHIVQDAFGDPIGDFFDVAVAMEFECFIPIREKDTLDEDGWPDGFTGKDQFRIVPDATVA